MSYQHMDHAGWVEVNNAAARRLGSGRKKLRAGIGFAGSPEKLSSFQARVMDILGMAFGGIYNAPIVWDGVDWRFGLHGLSVPIRTAGISSFDFQELTMLVFLCHEARIRLTVKPHAPMHLHLQFSFRGHTGGMMARHPNLDEAVAAFRAYLPPRHRIIYPADLPPEPAPSPAAIEA